MKVPHGVFKGMDMTELGKVLVEAYGRMMHRQLVLCGERPVWTTFEDTPGTAAVILEGEDVPVAMVGYQLDPPVPTAGQPATMTVFGRIYGLDKWDSLDERDGRFRRRAR